MNLNTNFKVLKRCRGKIEWLIFEMLIIRNKRSTLNTQADSIRAKLLKIVKFKLLVCSIFTPQFNCTYSWHFIFLYIYHQFMLIFFAFDNDDMESSKGRVTFLSLIFLFLNVCRNRSLSEILSALLLVSRLLLIVRFQYITIFNINHLQMSKCIFLTLSCYNITIKVAFEWLVIRVRKMRKYCLAFQTWILMLKTDIDLRPEKLSTHNAHTY